MRAGLVFAAALLVAPSARADAAAAVAGEPWQIATPKRPAAPPVAPPKPKPTPLPCMFVPRPDCRDYPLLELSLAGGESHSYVGWQWALRGTAELGLLVAVTPHLHVGPALEIGFDEGRITSGWSAVPKVRGRLWLGESNFTLEGSIGTLFERYAFHDGYEARNRVGAAADLSISYHGVGSLLGSVSLAADPTGVGGTEVRLLFGFRGSVLAWGVIAVAPFAAYAAK
jgi:hypothetical protein